MEEMAVGKQLEELIAWTAMIEAMSNEQLKDYVLNRPESLRSVKTGKNAPGKKMLAINAAGEKKWEILFLLSGLMAIVWKYHKEDDDEASIS
ncbi:hypothetical protein MUK42_34419 [Musa troglodytarum]|uniref:Uncharacterized protein n=1 Tax=Musa troglodytarum TaxID=320322 RepID=A0A9E7E8A2_9LILI|nr:hypothetical protein MUK42_34419 [Musa troglodytarum]